MTTPSRYATAEYSVEEKSPPFLRITLDPQFAPVDINLLYLSRKGWSPGDRLRIALKPMGVPKEHPLATMMAQILPHVLLRRFDRDEDAFLAITFSLEGPITVESNDREFAWHYVEGLLLECPPSFHAKDELKSNESWVTNGSERARFLGMLHGALGWDSSHQIPPAIQESLEEAENALVISNYRSCVAMCRRMTEATLKFGHERLLKRKPVDKKGKDLMLNELIQRFKNAPGHPIPLHILHVADSLRVIGNVPGAHAKDIENYQFSRTDAEFAIGSAHYFVDQYFSKVDPEVTKLYTVTIDLKSK